MASRPVRRSKSAISRKQRPLVVKSNGKLRKAAGVNKNGKVNRAKAEALARGKGITAKRARFFLNVLAK